MNLDCKLLKRFDVMMTAGEGKNRNLFLQEEVFFVTKNTKSYYELIYALNIKVLKTAFHVKNQRKHQNAETHLSRKKIVLLNNQGKFILDMLPDEKESPIYES